MHEFRPTDNNRTRPYYICKGRADSLRAAQGERCTARYIPAEALDQLVWQDLCCILTDPTVITHELERAQAGEGLPQALQARRQTIKEALAQLDFAQRRQLVELLIDRVVVDDGQVEIRYVIPTSAKGEESRFCHLRKDYFNIKT